MTKPEIGQWWFPDYVEYGSAEDFAVLVCGFQDDLAIVYMGDKLLPVCMSLNGWHHEPECDDWDWIKRPETFPQFWSKHPTNLDPNDAFIKRVDADHTITVRKDGTHFRWGYAWLKEKEEPGRTRLTEGEALALLDPQPAEESDDWVVQDRVPARPGIDKERWVDKCGTPTGPWEYSSSIYRRHGDTEGTDYRVELCCRRSQLPQPKAKTRTITVPKWLIKIGSIWKTYETSDIPQGFDEVHRIGETTYKIKNLEVKDIKY
jgi:hypothetical protein